MGACLLGKKYGLLDGGVLTEDERHRRIKERQQVKYSMNPERLRQIAELVCGKEVEVSEPGPYTFRLNVIIRGSEGKNKADKACAPGM